MAVGGYNTSGVYIQYEGKEIAQSIYKIAYEEELVRNNILIEPCFSSESINTIRTCRFNASASGHVQVCTNARCYSVNLSEYNCIVCHLRNGTLLFMLDFL